MRISPNVLRILNKMVDKGLVRKERQSDDQRIAHISLTEKGRRLHKQAEQTIIGYDVERRSKKRQVLIELLRKSEGDFSHAKNTPREFLPRKFLTGRDQTRTQSKRRES